MKAIAITIAERLERWASHRQQHLWRFRATSRKSTQRSWRSGSVPSWNVTAFHKQSLRSEFCVALKEHSRTCCAIPSHGRSWSRDGKHSGEWRSGFKSPSTSECQLCDWQVRILLRRRPGAEFHLHDVVVRKHASVLGKAESDRGKLTHTCTVPFKGPFNFFLLCVHTIQTFY